MQQILLSLMAVFGGQQFFKASLDWIRKRKNDRAEADKVSAEANKISAETDTIVSKSWKELFITISQEWEKAKADIKKLYELLAEERKECDRRMEEMSLKIEQSNSNK